MYCSCVTPPPSSPIPTVGDHMVVVRNLLSHRGNKNGSNIMAEYHIGSFRGYGIKMDKK